MYTPVNDTLRWLYGPIVFRVAPVHTFVVQAPGFPELLIENTHQKH